MLCKNGKNTLFCYALQKGKNTTKVHAVLTLHPELDFIMRFLPQFLKNVLQKRLTMIENMACYLGDFCGNMHSFNPLLHSQMWKLTQPHPHPHHRKWCHFSFHIFITDGNSLYHWGLLCYSPVNCVCGEPSASIQISKSISKFQTYIKGLLMDLAVLLELFWKGVFRVFYTECLAVVSEVHSK